MPREPIGGRSSPDPAGLAEVSEDTRRERDDEAPAARRALVPRGAPAEDAEPRDPKRAVDERPPGLQHLTPSARLRLQLVLDQDDEGRPRASAPPLEPTAPPLLGQLALGPAELLVVRSLRAWVGFSGLMHLSVGALTGLSYFTGEGQIAHVVVGILATGLSAWLLGAAFNLHRVARRKPRPRHHLVSAFGLLRSALLLKALLVFAAMVLGCFTFSLAVSLLLLL